MPELTAEEQQRLFSSIGSVYANRENCDPRQEIARWWQDVEGALFDRALLSDREEMASASQAMHILIR